MEEKITDGINVLQSGSPVKDGLFKSFNLIERIVASTVGACITAVVVTPFDVVKARLQAQTNIKGQLLLPSQFSSSLDAVMKIGKTEGLFNLWRGLGTTLILTVPANSFYFTTYEALKAKLERDFYLNSVTASGIAGTSARIITVTISSPIELVRTYLQATSSTTVTNIGLVPTLRAIVKNGGVMSLWSGLTPTIWRDAPFSAIYWSSYEYFKRSILPIAGNKNKFFVDFFSGATAGMLAAIFSHPFDVIKTRRQMQIPTNKDESTHTLQLLRKIMKEEGIEGLTKGIVPRVAKVAPACAIMISFYELCKKYLLQY